MVTECMTEHLEDAENIFVIPSRLVRELTGVIYGDGYKYLDQEEKQIGRYINAGENWKNQQTCLLMSTDALNKALEQNQYRMFWLFRVYRAPSHKAYETFNNQIMHDTDRNFTVWFEGDECKFVELQNIEPADMGADKYASIVDKYL